MMTQSSGALAVQRGDRDAAAAFIRATGNGVIY
jgi:hypothetical protein